VARGVVEARGIDGPTVVYVETDRYLGVPGYESWWDVPIAEVSDVPEAQAARAEYEQRRRAQRRPL
jgi:3D-(3,5/4)-trihydroxycyclohexane-1,2-dione acylhydrolase (decyclizing)